MNKTTEESDVLKLLPVKSQFRTACNKFHGRVDFGK